MSERSERTLESPEKYCRVNITKNTKGYQAETTISLRWSDAALDAETELRQLLADADELARDEIARRQRMDDLEGGAQ